MQALMESSSGGSKEVLTCNQVEVPYKRAGCDVRSTGRGRGCYHRAGLLYQISSQIGEPIGLTWYL